MLEIRFLIETGMVTGWCGDATAFGKLDRGRDTEAIVILDMDVPPGDMGDYTFNGQTLDYQEPEPTLSFSTHLGKVTEINPAAVKPIKIDVHHEKEDAWKKYDCFVTENIKDQFTQGDIQVDSWVLVEFFEGNRLNPICVDAVYKSWE